MEALLSIAVSNAIVATLLAALAFVVACYCRRPTVRHALWLLVILKLITPPLVSLSVTWPRTEKLETPLAESPPPALEPPSESEPIELTAPISEPRDWPAAPEIETPTVSPPFTEIWMPLLMAIWLGGSLAWWTVAAVRLWRFQRLLRQARPAPTEVRNQARRLAQLLGLRHCPPIVFVTAPLSPMLWALGWSPRLLIPAELWRKLTAEQQDTLLAHELAHLRRGDPWVRRLEFLVLGLYWWHPVAWLARRRLQEAEEECCDALVVTALPESASDYAAALVQTVAFLSQSPIAAPFGASGAGHVPLLKRRLTMILQDDSSRKPSRLAFWFVLGLGVLLLPLAPRAARTEALEEPQSETEKGAALKLVDEPSGRQAKSQEPDRSQEIEKLQDEIELLRLQVRLKEARLRGARTSLPLAQTRLEVARQFVKQNLSSPEEVLKAQTAVAASQAEIEAKELELQEARLILKQAERRLARFQRPAEGVDGGGRARQEKRLGELEQKVESLLKEIHNLRREMQPEKRKSKEEGKNETSQRQKRMLRWSIRFNTENAAEYVAQLRSLGAILAVPVREGKNDVQYKIVRDLVARPAPLLDEDISKSERIYWVDDKKESVGDVLATLGIRLGSVPSHFVAFMPQELEQKLFRLEKSYLDKHHAGRTEDDIVATRFHIKRSGSSFEPEVADLWVRDLDREHQEARGFIYRVWPALETSRLEDNIPKAQKAFQKCKELSDRVSVQKLLKGTEGHADRLTKELAALRPDLIIDDEKQAKMLKKLSEQVVKLGAEIQEYLKAHTGNN